MKLKGFNMNQLLVKGCFIIIPYLIGLAISDRVIIGNEKPNAATSQTDTSIDPLDGITFFIHRNGEAEPCGETLASLSLTSFEISGDEQLSDLDKYEFDNFLTDALATVLPGQDRMGSPTEQVCGPEQPPKSIKGSRRRTWGRGADYKIDGVKSPFLNFCDMGPDHTPILPDHDELVHIDSGGVLSLPCHFHTREGMRISSFEKLIDFVEKQKSQQALDNNLEEECTVSEDGSNVCTAMEDASSAPALHLYAVPAGRIFMFAPSYIGEVFDIDHVDMPVQKPISLKVMSLTPRVFDIINFFDRQESQTIVDKAMAETSESHRMKRSSTGASGYNVNSQRTSENGFDTHGKVAMTVKKRCLEILGFDHYDDSFTDGLQVLRYNKTTAYIPHMDWIDDPRKAEAHNYDSARQGTNRHSTILLYMSDLEIGDGGETVFKNGWPVGLPADERKTREVALAELRESGDAKDLRAGSWEESMVADCRSRLAVVPHSARAVLFYSQHPNGEEDRSSLHGGCPVLSGEKWAANLWVWNGPRGGFPGAPMNPGKEIEKDDGQIKLIFENSGKDPIFAEAKLYFQETFWGDFSHGDPALSINTYEGHEWNVRRISDNKLLKRVVIEGGKKHQKYVV